VSRQSQRNPSRGRKGGGRRSRGEVKKKERERIGKKAGREGKLGDSLKTEPENSPRREGEVLREKRIEEEGRRSQH